MNRSLVLVAAAALVFGLAAPAFAQSNARSPDREWRQEQRIHRGHVRGQLSPREMRQLERQQRRLDRAQIRAERDGYLSHGERRRLERLQDRASRNIWRKKHNHDRNW